MVGDQDEVLKGKLGGVDAGSVAPDERWWRCGNNRTARARQCCSSSGTGGS